MARYTMGEVRIEGTLQVNPILELSMNIGVNRHGLLEYGGIISGEDAARVQKQKEDGQIIKLFLRDELEFCGHALKVTIDYKNEAYFLRVVAASRSQLLDIIPRSRFFQDVQRTYADIITEAYTDSGTGNLVAFRGGQATGKQILQYRENDWQFTLRMAGRLGTVVVPNNAAHQAQVCLGIPKRAVVVEPNPRLYTVSRSAERYRKNRVNNAAIGYQDFISYQLKSNNRYKLGDSVNIDGKVMAVVQKSFTYARGEMEEHYVLALESNCCVPLHHNKHIADLFARGNCSAAPQPGDASAAGH